MRRLTHAPFSLVPLVGLAVAAALVGGCAEEPTCGDGVVQADEACDDGNADDTDGCTTSCELPRCGDGFVQAAMGEECDDGNRRDDDACLSDCRAARCGDGFVQAGVEACDDGNGDNSDACVSTASASCVLATCGDGLVWAGHESCDDGNDDAADGCDSACVAATCGDGVVQGGEECDDGNASDRDACLTSCLAARCGDGVVEDGVEACDDGDADDHDGCTNACTVARCGDGVVHAGVEACDDGNADESDGCTTLCRAATCGDGEVQAGEACDDGNVSDTDGCLTTCVPARCGDGHLDLSAGSTEVCDDGNASNHDACLNDCTPARCGDGFVEIGVEACDDGNDDDDDACAACQPTRCGDGVVQAGEECDDGNASNSDACLDDCRAPRCGDGFVYAGVELCDDGNADDHDGCTNACTLPSCGDGVVQAGEACDDGNASNTDACLSTCLPARCGDGWVEAGVEGCDDGNASDGDACLSDCTPARCGDGVVHVGVEGCDDGNDVSTDACLPSCTPARCGDGLVWAGVEDCDDLNFDNTDGCLMTCADFDWCQGFGIVAVTPPVACETARPETLVLTASGYGFLYVEGVAPRITFAPADASSPPVEAVVRTRLDCGPVQGGFVDAEGCARLEVVLPASVDSVGTYVITVDNPVTQACSDTALFSLGPVPTITDIDPTQFCGEVGFTLVISGTGFVGSTQVILTAQDGTIYTADVTLTPDGKLHASIGEDGVVDTGLPPGTYDVTVSNGVGCANTWPDAIVVHPRPIIFFIDPPVIYNGVDLQATMYVANINGGGVQTVRMRRLQTNNPWEILTHAYDPTSPFRVRIEVPADRVGPNEQFDYAFTVTDALGCPAALDGVAELTKRVTFQGFVAQPPFGGTDEATAVSIVVPEEVGGTPFEDGARIYLNPTAPGEDTTPLSSVGFIDGANLTALVQSGLTPGDYQIIIVNPDGTVGLSDPPIPGGFRVTSAPPPMIDGIAPGSVPTTSTLIKVFGDGFVAGVHVGLTCVPAGGGVAGSYGADNVTLTSYGLSFDIGDNPSPPQDSVCVIRVTNPDGAYADFSAVVLLNSSENIPPSIEVDKPMSLARRAPVALVGSVSNTARFLYAIGGDNGSTVSAYDRIEVVALTPFGELRGDWRDLPKPLPAPRTLAQGATVGKFLYVVGGDAGAGAVRTAWRAEVLRPEDSPVLDGELVIALDPAGIGPGLWYYRVSAVMSSADADNPGGETLPSEPLAIQVPPWAPDNFQVTLTWAPVPGAVGYRVYRTATADQPLSTVVLVASVAQPRFVETGLTPIASPDPSLPTTTPRVLGDLGEWAPLPSLGTARADFGLAVGADPVDPTVRYLYATGGRNGLGVADGTYELLSLALGADQSQAVGLEWLSDPLNTFTPRRGHGAFSVDQTVTTWITDDTSYVYVGSGYNSTESNFVKPFQSGRVQAGGLLTSWFQANNGGTNNAYYGAVAASNQLFVLGGNGSSTSRDSGRFTSSAQPPQVGGINATPGDLAVGRERMGATLGSGRIFLLGGQTPSGVTARIESSPW
ncbi:MAG: DUF4215 domain-containing protein [Deltaproteobacteria bacterium]|nr:MAG: DUF4215 domain-containing protein [Deltaproteobacteria bacterium]